MARKSLQQQTCCFIGYQEIPPGEERKILMRVQHRLLPLISSSETNVQFFGLTGEPGFNTKRGSKLFWSFPIMATKILSRRTRKHISSKYKRLPARSCMWLRRQSGIAQSFAIGIWLRVQSIAVFTAQNPLAMLLMLYGMRNRKGKRCGMLRHLTLAI